MTFAPYPGHVSKRRVIGEAARFMAVGAIATTAAVLSYNWLAYEPWHIWSPMHGHLTWAYIVSHLVVGMSVSYELSRRWTFKNRSGKRAGEGFLSFAIINIVTMVTIPVGCMWVSRNWLGLTSPLADNVAGNVVGLLLSQVARFYLFRTFVFHRRIRYTEVYDDPSAEPEDDTVPEPERVRD